MVEIVFTVADEVVENKDLIATYSLIFKRAKMPNKHVDKTRLDWISFNLLDSELD